MVQPREGFCLFFWKKMDKNVGFLLLFPENYKKVDFITKVFPVCSDIQSVNKQIKKLQHFSKKCCSFCLLGFRHITGISKEFLWIYTRFCQRFSDIRCWRWVALQRSFRCMQQVFWFIKRCFTEQNNYRSGNGFPWFFCPAGCCLFWGWPPSAEEQILALPSISPCSAVISTKRITVGKPIFMLWNR